jgi:hypothetical protein
VISPSESSGEIPTGTVVFLDGSSMIGSASLVNGQAVFSSPIYDVGQTHIITASYQGDAHFTGSSSNGLSETTAKADVEIVFNVTAIPQGRRRIRAYEVNVILVNHGGGLDPSAGVLTYLVNGRRFARQRFTGDTIRRTIPSAMLQGRNLSVRYDGDSNFNGADSQIFRITRRGIQPLGRLAARTHARPRIHTRR